MVQKSSQAIAAALGEGPGGFRHIGGTKAMAAATTGSTQLRPKPATVAPMSRCLLYQNEGIIIVIMNDTDITIITNGDHLSIK